MGRLLLLAICMMVAVPAQAGYMSGGELAKWGASYERNNAEVKLVGEDLYGGAAFAGYVNGVIDVYYGLSICPPSGVKLGQLFLMVAKYLREHPSEWHYDASSLVTKALTSSFPCK